MPILGNKIHLYPGRNAIKLFPLGFDAERKEVVRQD